MKDVKDVTWNSSLASQIEFPLAGPTECGSANCSASLKLKIDEAKYFLSSTTSHFHLTLPFPSPLPSLSKMANTIAEQPNLKAHDHMEGLSHSEVHYFNRYAEKKCREPCADAIANEITVTITMVSDGSLFYPIADTNPVRHKASTRKCWSVSIHLPPHH